MSRTRVVVVVCDGHRDDFVIPDLCPSMAGFAARARRFRNHTAIFPSATRASAASIATGCWPARHGLHGNTMGLPDGCGVRVHDVGDPAFVGKLRTALGRTLKVPTLAERLAKHGGAVVASNVSPGAAYFQDPDHFGHVVHRAGSFGPGGRALGPDEAPVVSHDAAGDAALADWICDTCLTPDGPTLTVLWLSDPDLSMHADALGSATHLAGIASADVIFARVEERVEALRSAGQNVLLIACSDHGQETVAGQVALEGDLVAANLKAAPDSTEVVVAPQGGSALIYLSGEGLRRRERVLSFLSDHSAVADVFPGDAMHHIGQAPGDGLAIAVGMSRDDAKNENDVPGRIWTCVSDSKPGKPLGRGSHGGLGRWERHPFLMIAGGGFAPGSEEHGRTRLIDLAPTILRHLGLPRDGMDGLALPQT